MRGSQNRVATVVSVAVELNGIVSQGSNSHSVTPADDSRSHKSIAQPQVMTGHSRVWRDGASPDEPAHREQRRCRSLGERHYNDISGHFQRKDKKTERWPPSPRQATDARSARCSWQHLQRMKDSRTQEWRLQVLPARSGPDRNAPYTTRSLGVGAEGTDHRRGEGLPKMLRRAEEVTAVADKGSWREQGHYVARLCYRGRVATGVDGVPKGCRRVSSSRHATPLMWYARVRVVFEETKEEKDLPRGQRAREKRRCRVAPPHEASGQGSWKRHTS